MERLLYSSSSPTHISKPHLKFRPLLSRLTRFNSTQLSFLHKSSRLSESCRVNSLSCKNQVSPLFSSSKSKVSHSVSLPPRAVSPNEGSPPQIDSGGLQRRKVLFCRFEFQFCVFYAIWCVIGEVLSLFRLCFGELGFWDFSFIAKKFEALYRCMYMLCIW